MDRDPFKEYIKQNEPDKREKGYAWSTAIGLQAVDGLQTSKYLVDTAIRNVEGDITIDEAINLLNTYYEENPSSGNAERTEEADKVSARIAKILSEKTFGFSSNEYIYIHKRLFEGILKHSGELRKYNITKKEWVLNGATVIYGDYANLSETLKYDLTLEKEFDYSNLSQDEVIKHLSKFVANLWQNHAFGEGNTRTTAVFLIKYLRKLGYDVTNDCFAENARYFRNSLVRANYSDIKNGIYPTTEYLELFLRNAIFNEKNELHNRELHISNLLKKETKADIKTIKANIEIEKADIETKLKSLNVPVFHKTIEHVHSLLEVFSTEEYFGRGDVERVTALKATRASELINIMLSADLIEPVHGHGKGKYRFK